MRNCKHEQCISEPSEHDFAQGSCLRAIDVYKIIIDSWKFKLKRLLKSKLNVTVHVSTVCRFLKKLSFDSKTFGCPSKKHWPTRILHHGAQILFKKWFKEGAYQLDKVGKSLHWTLFCRFFKKAKLGQLCCVLLQTTIDPVRTCGRTPCQDVRQDPPVRPTCQQGSDANCTLICVQQHAARTLKKR